MSQCAVTFLYTGNADRVQTKYCTFYIAHWSLLFYKHDLYTVLNGVFYNYKVKH